jgi:hypothetical protein
MVTVISMLIALSLVRRSALANVNSILKAMVSFAVRLITVQMPKTSVFVTEMPDAPLDKAAMIAPVTLATLGMENGVALRKPRRVQL